MTNRLPVKGMDISCVRDIEKYGGVYYRNGIPEDPLKIFRKKGINLFRVRLWNDPFDENGESYGAGTCDLNSCIALFERAKELGVDTLLDFHYSDCWADPGKQRVPKAWRNKNLEELKAAVYEYTKEVLLTLKEKGLTPKMISVGNEITNGFLWPIGKVPHFDAIAQLVSCGIAACREAAPESRVMLHLDNGGNTEMYRNWFASYFEKDGADFDVIGLSYYPAWHGSLSDLRRTMEYLEKTYHKDMIVAETSYPFSMEDYRSYEGFAKEEAKGMALKEELVRDLPFEISPKGQSDFLRALRDTVFSVPNEKGLGFIYWGGELIPRKGSTWGSEAGIAYMEEKGPGGNEWANQAVFDYHGEALPILDTIKEL